MVEQTIPSNAPLSTSLIPADYIPCECCGRSMALALQRLTFRLGYEHTLCKSEKCSYNAGILNTFVQPYYRIDVN